MGNGNCAAHGIEDSRGQGRLGKTNPPAVRTCTIVTCRALSRNPESYPHPRLQVKGNTDRHRKTTSGRNRGVGISFGMLVICPGEHMPHKPKDLCKPVIAGAVMALCS